MRASQAKTKSRFDSHSLQINLPPGSYVMKKDPTRSSTLQSYYEDTYKVSRRTSNGTYVLQDATGSLLPRNTPPSHLKLISYTPPEDQHSFEIDAVINHRGQTNRDRAYLIKWKHNHPDTWVPEVDFDDLAAISRYWDRRHASTRTSSLEEGNVKKSSITPQQKSLSPNNKTHLKKPIKLTLKM